MQTQPKRLFLTFCLSLLLAACDPASYVSSSHHFKDKYQLSEVKVPSFPPKTPMEPTPIRISFPRQNEFKLQLSANTCGGKYEASTNGTIAFTHTNCTRMCCDSEWEVYILSLIRKAQRFEGGTNGPLYLYIDKTNYLVLEVATAISTQN